MAFIGRLPDPTSEAWDWQVEAACRGMASALFFHPWGERGPSRDERVRKAKQVCSGCPVIDECRRHALQVHEQYGVWGGLSEEERQVLLNRGRRSLRRKVIARSTELQELMGQGSDDAAPLAPTSMSATASVSLPMPVGTVTVTEATGGPITTPFPLPVAAFAPEPMVGAPVG